MTIKNEYHVYDSTPAISGCSGDGGRSYFIHAERVSVYDSPCGKLYIGVKDNRVVRCDWREPHDNVTYEATPLAEKVICMLTEYFAGLRKEFTLPLAEPATPFARDVMIALERVAYGSTVSYADLTEMAGKTPGSVRAVAHVLATNPISILRPCHRVLPKDSTRENPGQYRGGTSAKAFLLSLEMRNR